MENLVESWKQLIDVRKQTHSWDMDREVNRQDIDDIFSELHRRVPVKQNRVHYKISVLDYSDPEFRDTYYNFCVDRDNPNPQYNPQVLAPYLLVFSFRNPGEFDADFSGHGFGEYAKQLSCIETGLAADFIVHAAASRGLNCGFCRCYDTKFRPDQIASKLGIDSVHNIIVSMGIGYASEENKTLNPHTGKMVDSFHDQKWRTEPKPAMNDYIKFIE